MADESALPWIVRRELAILRASAGVDEASIALVADGTETRIQFTVTTEKSATEPYADIRATEQIGFVYGGVEEIGIGPPRSVRSLRADFPRDIGHLNPAKDGAPASICLAAAGLAPVYDRFGIEGVLERLRGFLRDAKIGALMQDGWEPVPYGDVTEFCLGSFDPRFFQECAAAKPDGGIAFGAARVLANFCVLFSGEIALSKLPAAIVAQNGQPKNETLWVFVWGPAAQRHAAPIFGDWRTYGEIRAGLNNLSLLEHYEQALGAALASGVRTNVISMASAKTVILVVGVWRPCPLRPTIHGLSPNLAARKLEIRAYRIQGTGSDEPLNDNHRAEAIATHSFATPDLFEFTSGVTAPNEIGIVGVGALGSAIAEEMLRSGVRRLSVMDYDKLAPHNLARHIGRHDDVFSPKVESIDALASSLGFPNKHAEVRPLAADITAIAASDLVRKLGQGPILDATANERVRRHLSKAQHTQRLPLFRTEIFHRGRLGVLFACNRSSADLLDLYCTLLLESVDHPAIAQWLADDHALPTSLDQLQFGFGCASATVKLPNFVVRQHAASFMPTLLQPPSGAAIGLNPLTASFEPLGWKLLDVPDFTVFMPKPAVGWRVSMHGAVIDKMRSLRASALPNETGGYLYGGWDAATQSISVVFASDEPSGTKATSSSLELGPAGHTNGERRLIHATRQRLGLVGSWHSHPGASSALSKKDLATIKVYAQDDRARFVPTLAVVVADGIDVHLEA